VDQCRQCCSEDGSNEVSDKHCDGKEGTDLDDDIGSTGIVGSALINLLLLENPENPVGSCKKVYALSHRPLPPWYIVASSSSSNNDPMPTVVYLHVDLTDDATVTKALVPLTDITHVFYVTWAPCHG